MKEFIMGLAVGMAGGALIVANSYKVRQMVKKNQEEFLQKAESYIDEKLEKGSSTGGSQCCGGTQGAAHGAEAGKKKEN